MALLAIDQGNTRTKFGLFSAGTLQHTWSLPTQKSASADALSEALMSHHLPDTTIIGLCSVVPESSEAWRQFACQHGYTLHLITGRTATPLRNAYETQKTLGPDRLMMAVAAASRVGTPVIPISLGTAIVVDAVSPDGVYLGGMIAPGIDTIANALTNAASALQRVEWQEPSNAIGRTSLQAQTSGLFHQSLGGIRAMIQAVRHELHTDAPLALTGGWAHRVAPFLDHVALIDEYLVLHGIAITLDGQASR